MCVGWDKVKTIANAIKLPLYVETVTGSSLDTGADYLPKEGDEVEDLYRLLERVQKETEVTGVAVGAILSDYQRIRQLLIFYDRLAIRKQTLTL